MKTPIFLITVLFTFISFKKSQAQSADSTHYDFGRQQVRKELVQSVTIKGTDLEKMPFSDLTDAVNAWLYGIYGSNISFVPVIDGIQMNDMNVYSIYDIDEITLIQNSSSVLNGMSPQQFLLLITTRHNKNGKHGIEAAGQANLIQSRNTSNSTPGKSSTNVYHQYYLSGYINTDKIQAGISGNFQRDVTPFINTPYAMGYSPRALQRLTLNGYLDILLDTHNTLSLNGGYLPQTDKDYSALQSFNTIQTIRENAKTDVYYSTLSFKSNYGALKNVVSGGYQHYKLDENQYLLTTGSSLPTLIATSDAYVKSNNFVVKDNLTYTLKVGDWNIEPNVNFEYRHSKDTLSQMMQTQSGSNVNVSSGTTNYFQKSSTLIPALTVAYRDILDVQGGFLTVLSNTGAVFTGYKSQKTYPFASVMFDAGKLIGTTRFKVFGSYAKTTSNMQNPYPRITVLSGNSVDVLYGSSISEFLPSFYDPNKTYNQWQAGAEFNVLKNIALSYNFTQRRFITDVYTPIFYGGGTYMKYFYPDAQLTSHRVAVDFNVFNSNILSWHTNVNATYFKCYTNTASANIPAGYYIVNNFATDHFVTGGIVNRISYKKAFLGADLLYVFHTTDGTVNTAASPKHVNLFDLQNIYAGYKFNVGVFKNLELFVNARSIIENRSTLYIDTRKYYGVGFRASL